MLVNTQHAAKTVADLKRPGMRVVLGADNSASSNLIFAVIAKEVLGLNINVVRGYTGAAPLFLATLHGEEKRRCSGIAAYDVDVEAEHLLGDDREDQVARGRAVATQRHRRSRRLEVGDGLGR